MQNYATYNFEENYYLNYCCPRNYTPSQFMLFLSSTSLTSAN